MLLLMDSSSCWGRTGDRILSLTTRPEATLIDMWCLGDKRSVAVNTAHFLSALQGCSSPTDTKCEAITLSTPVKMTAALMLSGIVVLLPQCMTVMFFLLLFVWTNRTEYCTVFHVWQQSLFLFCSVKSQHGQTNYCVAEFHLMWKSNWMDSSTSK